MEQSIDSMFTGRHESDPRSLLYFEWRQRLESGYAVGTFEPEVRALAAAPAAATPDADACWAVFGRLESAGREPGWDYYEPELFDASWSTTATPVATAALGSIRATGGSVPTAVADPPIHGVTTSAPTDLMDRIHGGWLGRCIGCTLGKPLENGYVWTPGRIRKYLDRARAYPLSDYVPALLPPVPEFPLNSTWTVAAKGRVDGAPRDDDVDYTVLGLHLLESCGPNFATADVAKAWLERLPFLRTYTAERVVYRNLVGGLHPLAASGYRNPFREWIGALIRADIYGYVSPGDPVRAATLATRDATLSHTGNGVYAAAWAAALVAAAAAADNAPAALATAQQLLPARSRLAIALAEVRTDYNLGLGWDEAMQAIHRRHDHYNWIHAIPNACLITAGLLWGAGDFTKTIALTVQGGCDTDSNGATAGSVAGILTGAAAIPAHWTEPFHDRLHSAVYGFDGSQISDLARRTFALAQQG